MIATYYDAPTDEGSGLMRGAAEQPGSMFSYISPEERVPADHPLRAVRRITDRALERLPPHPHCACALHQKCVRTELAGRKRTLTEMSATRQ